MIVDSEQKQSPRPLSDSGKSEVSIVTSVSEIDIPEGESALLFFRLSARPDNDVTVTIFRVSADPHIRILSRHSVTIPRQDFNRWQVVVLAAFEDPDSVNGEAELRFVAQGIKPAVVTLREIDNDQELSPNYRIVTDRTDVSVPEGGSASFQVKLSSDPGGQVVVLAGRLSGDTDIRVEAGSTLTFDSGNWDSYQAVTLSAAEDSDDAGGQAVIAVSAPGIPDVNVTAMETDNDASASKRIVIDPVSRIEGHLRIEVEVSNGEVKKAWSTATLFRGIEKILIGRDPHDAPLITQRLCGVCTYVHQLCSVRAIEDAAAVQIPDNARIVRNLMLGAQFMHDHLIHFFHLHGPDWIDLTSALAADPAATENLAYSLSPEADPIDFDAVRSRLENFAAKGKLGPFANAYWGHSDYALSPEENLLLMAHYLKALEKQIVAARIMAVMGGKNPHPQSTVVGGVTCGGELTAERFADLGGYLDDIRQFIDTVYLPDIGLIADRYPEWAGRGQFFNFLACGEFPQGRVIPDDLFFPGGAIFNGDLFNVQALDQAKITEHLARSWYAGDPDQHPSVGVTRPSYTGLDLDSEYSWLKAPRYDGEPMEVGPLARILVGYGMNRSAFVRAVDTFLAGTGLVLDDLFSTLGRTAARAIETSIIAGEMASWLDELSGRISRGKSQIFQDYVLPSGSGIGFLEAPRGALGHWLTIQSGTIGNYQMVVPTTWNLGPRCCSQKTGPLEKALAGLPVADPANPLEVIRVVHSFDPCVACGVHVLDVDENARHEIPVV